MHGPNQQKPMSIVKLIRTIRDAGSTEKAERMLLLHLALRCQPDEQYKASPTYAVLAQDTLLDDMTLRRAAAALEKKKLIRRVRRTSRSNEFFINVVLLKRQAEERQAKLEPNWDLLDEEDNWDSFDEEGNPTPMTSSRS